MKPDGVFPIARPADGPAAPPDAARSPGPIPPVSAFAAPSPEPLTTTQAFFDLSFTWRELWLCAAVLAMTVALQMAPRLGTAVGGALLLALSVTCWTNPFLAFYYIACSQVLPFPPGSTLNPAQIGFFSWPVVVLFSRGRFTLRGLWTLLAVAPLVLWMGFVGMETNILSPRSEYMKAIFYAIIGCHYANQARGRYLKMLLGLCLGAAAVVLGFWAAKAGLPVQLHEYSAGLARGGFGRLGSARADSVMVWPPVLMSVFGMAGAVLTVARYETHGNQTRILTWGALAVAALSVPPMAATMTHGAYFGFGLMSVALIAAVAVRAIQRGLTLDEKRRILRLVMAGVIAVAVIVSQNWFGAQDRIVGLWNYYRSERSGGSAAASRTDVWQYSMRTIREHPWLGVRFTGAQEEIPPEYRAKGGYLSHNVFLDYARYAGIPCMLAAAWFFIYPVIQLLRAPERWRYTSFFFAYFVMFIFWMTLSFQFYKTFWGLWMLVAIMAKDHQGTLRGGGRLSKGMAA